jgi:hypothetical protein
MTVLADFHPHTLSVTERRVMARTMSRTIDRALRVMHWACSSVAVAAYRRLDSMLDMRQAVPRVGLELVGRWTCRTSRYTSWTTTTSICQRSGSTGRSDRTVRGATLADMNALMK